MSVEEIVMVAAPTKELLNARINNCGTPFAVLGSQDENGRHAQKSFMAFPDHDTFLQYIMSKPESARNQYEIIRGEQPSCMYK
jgi:hypothetical protein